MNVGANGKPQNWEVTDKDNRWVSDGLEDELPKWSHHCPVLISAPTGRGKNYFIMNILIPYALDRGQPVFLFSNRIALNVQQKKELLKALEIPNTWSDEELQQKEEFSKVGVSQPQVFVLSYQSVLGFLSNHYISVSTNMEERNPLKSGYAIFDEAHFFLNDALFNADTQRIFHQLFIRLFGHTRIYMTATPENIADIILGYENHYAGETRRTTVPDMLDFCGNRRTSPDFVWHYYNFSRNYSNYNIKFFSSVEQLYPQIKASVKNGGKWLFFIDSRQRQQDIAKALKDQSGVKVDCFDRSKKQDDKIWNALLEGNIPHDVLLTTRALDNGVNITDPDLHNIVVECNDEVSFIQMIGRKRLNLDEGETVNLFVYVPKESVIQKYYVDLQELLKIIEDYRKAPSYFIQNKWHELHQKYRNLFWIDNYPDPSYPLPGYPYLNAFAEREIKYLQKFYGRVLSQMQGLNDSLAALDIYPKIVLGWLDRPQDAIDWVSGADIEHAIIEMKYLLEKHIQAGIEKEKHNKFFNEFKELADIILNGSRKVKNDPRSGPSIMSEVLKELKDKLGALYKIEGRGTWEIRKEEILISHVPQ